MQPLNLPAYLLKLDSIDGKECVFDIIRKKYVVLTPEEWVRQNFVHLLIQKYQYPKALIKIESGLKYNQISKRTDIQIYDRNGQLFLLVECKSVVIPLTEKVFEQVARYNFTLKAPYIAVTNGLKHYCCSINHATAQIKFLPDLPLFGELDS